jgi:hypothetical protein
MTSGFRDNDVNALLPFEKVLSPRGSLAACLTKVGGQ